MIDCSQHKPIQPNGASSTDQTSSATPPYNSHPSRPDAAVSNQIVRSPVYQPLDPSRFDSNDYVQIIEETWDRFVEPQSYSHVTQMNN